MSYTYVISFVIEIVSTAHINYVLTALKDFFLPTLICWRHRRRFSTGSKRAQISTDRPTDRPQLESVKRDDATRPRKKVAADKAIDAPRLRTCNKLILFLSLSPPSLPPFLLPFTYFYFSPSSYSRHFSISSLSLSSFTLPPIPCPLPLCLFSLLSLFDSPPQSLFLPPRSLSSPLPVTDLTR